MEYVKEFGLPGLCIVLSGGTLALIIKLIKKNGCILKLRSCCSTDDPCCFVDCNKGRGEPKKPKETLNAADEV